MLGSMTAVAAVEGDGGIYAEAVTVDGDEVILAGAPDPQMISALESYDLMIEEEPVLTVEQQLPELTAGADNNGYFSADFTIPDTTKQVFLVGLSADKVEEIQGKIIENYAVGADFKLEDLSFIDTEKTREADGDDYLCWAASASNILTYTGWAEKAGFETTDDLFEDYIASFTNKAGDPYYGFGWFFNGANTAALINPSSASATAGTGGYLTDYAYDMLSKTSDVMTDGVNGMTQLQQKLREGCGVILSLDIRYQGTPAGGHAVSCWGYIVDTAYDSADTDYYAGLFLTDSDSDEQRNKDRREAPDILKLVSLTYDSSLDSFSFDLDPNNYATLDKFTYLVPYSGDVEKEASADATKDKVNSPDLSISAYLDTDLSGSAYQWQKKIESNTTFYYTPVMMNAADTGYSGSTGINVTVTDAGGNSVLNRRFSSSFSVGPGYYTHFGTSLTKSGGLPEGDYTVMMTVNGDHAVTEAYYYNNTCSFTLQVRDSYLLGDTDNSGEVEIMDATAIQRYLADYDDGADEKTLQRAKITGAGVNIMDATVIQRYIARYSVNYPVGGKKLYD